jgi:thiol-disulfide isomerase/thioredoxin
MKIENSSVMKIKVLFLLFSVLPAGLCMAQDKFEISGRMSDSLTDKIVFLSYKNSLGKDAKDSSIVKKGRFAFTGTTAFGNRAYMELRSLKKDTSKQRRVADYHEFYLEKGSYKVSGRDSMATAAITGAQAQTDYLDYQHTVGTRQARYQQLAAQWMRARSAKDEAEMKRIVDVLKPIAKQMEAALDSFIFSHPDSYVTLDAVVNNKTAVIEVATFEPYYKPLSSRILSSYTGKMLTAKYDKAKQIAVGKTVDFTLPDDKGNNFQLASLKGKYVLVDFWASWCVPCRAENPHLLKAYNQLKDRKFEIVGISLDETKGAWLNAVKKDAMPWIQVSDLKGFKNEIALKYGITAIPQNFLLNPEGVIVAKNLRGEDVNEKIASFMK